jgi:flagellar protein FlgJ
MSINSLQNMPSSGVSTEARTDIYTDLNSLQNLKTSARKDAKGALPEVARQFEAVMISMMIKNLRKTGMEDPLFKSQAMDSYRDMYDQQLGMELSKGQGIGFAKAIVEQMQYQTGQQQNTEASVSPPERMPERRHFPDLYSSVSAENQNVATDSTKEKITQLSQPVVPKTGDSTFDSPGQFVEKLWPLAEKTAQKLGISPEMLLSQAALETGWGKHVISDDQNSSYNLFNIKAGSGWSGDRVEKVSVEYIYGKAIRQKSAFRSYDSFEQSFKDYADFIQSSPRYKNALNMANKVEQSLHDKSYIKGIHEAGYATDPNYSDNVLRVLNSEVIQNQLQFSEKMALK